MVFPLYDENPFTQPNPPFVTWGLIAINIVVFLATLGMPDVDQAKFVMSYGVTPAALTATTLEQVVGRADLTLLTSLFLHGGWEHLLGNMIDLWVFGDNIEHTFGRLRFLAFYLLAGVLSSLFFVAFNLQGALPLIGASGAIAGILSAYLLLHPCAKVSVLVFRIVVRVRAYWVIGGWVVLQVFLAIGEPDGEVAYLAHVGGLIAGVLLVFALRPAGTQILECVGPRESEAFGSGA